MLVLEMPRLVLDNPGNAPAKFSYWKALMDPPANIDHCSSFWNLWFCMVLQYVLS